MPDAEIHLISLLGTGAILAGSAWIVVAAVAHALATRRRWLPRRGRLANLRRRLQSALGPSGLSGASEERAVRFVAKSGRFRTWLRWGYRLPLTVLVVGELLHLTANLLTLRSHGQVDPWRVLSNSLAFLASVGVYLLIARLLLAASPRLTIVRGVLATAGRIAAIDDDAHEVQVDAALHEIGRLEQCLTSYFTVSHAAGDRYTRARFLAVNNGLYGQLVDLKQSVIFDGAIDHTHAREVLWSVLAAVAGDPSALSEAELAGVTGRRVAEAPRPRAAYRAAAVLTVLGVIAAVGALWYVDHSALSVIFSAVAAPLLLPVIVGLGRRGWTREAADDPKRHTDDRTGDSTAVARRVDADPLDALTQSVP